MGKRQIRVALWGLFGIGNYGNEGSLAAILNYLRKTDPHGEFVSICYDAARVEKDHQISAIPLSPQHPPLPQVLLLRLLRKLFLRLPREFAIWVKTIAFLRRVEKLVIPGTGVLDDFGLSPFGVPFDLFRWCLCAKLSGAEVLFISIGAGPVKNQKSRWFMKTAAQLAKYRSYRDRISLNFMSTIGVNTKNDRVYPDLAFSLPTPTRKTSPSVSNRPCTIGVGVMTYYGWQNDPVRGATIFKDYLEKITSFVLWLLREGHSVRLIIGDQSDAIAAAQIIDRVHAQPSLLRDGQFIANSISCLDDVLCEVANTDLVVTTRFHNVVCALMLDKPVISIGYAEKNDVLLMEMGLGKYCQHIERFDVNTLITHFCEVRKHLKQFEASIHSRRKIYQDQLEEQFATLFPASDAS